MPTKSTFESPFYALIGAADAAVENVRNSVDYATGSALSLRDELTPSSVQERILNTVNDVRDQIFAIPSLATESYELVAGNVERAYDDFAKSYLDYAQRGAEVTRDATEQGRSVVSAARTNAAETGDSTLTAVFGVRKEAAKGVERLAGLVGRNADVVESEAETVVRSNAAKQGAKRPSRSSVAKKATTRKSAAKKPVVKPAAAKKATAKKATVKTTTTAKKAPAKKAPAKKATATKTTTAKTTTSATSSAAPTLPVETKSTQDNA